jgi:hypothetical protein
MSKQVSISPNEAADRLAIRELVEAYAHCADRRDAKGQMALFTADTHFVVYMNAKDPNPSQELHSREQLAPVFADLNKYAATMHFVGQSTILSLTADRGTGEVYCLAHHLTIVGEVGVGITIAHDPLHGSGRADFPNPALTSGDDAHAAQGIRMISTSGRQPAGDQAPHPGPGFNPDWK